MNLTINVGDKNFEWFEEKLSPMKQNIKARDHIENFIDGSMVINTNSFYVINAITIMWRRKFFNNKLVKDDKIKVYLKGVETSLDKVYDKYFTEPMELFLWDGEKKEHFIKTGKILEDKNDE